MLDPTHRVWSLYAACELAPALHSTCSMSQPWPHTHHVEQVQSEHYTEHTELVWGTLWVWCPHWTKLVYWIKYVGWVYQPNARAPDPVHKVIFAQAPHVARTPDQHCMLYVAHTGSSPVGQMASMRHICMWHLSHTDPVLWIQHRQLVCGPDQYWSWIQYAGPVWHGYCMQHVPQTGPALGWGQCILHMMCGARDPQAAL